MITLAERPAVVTDPGFGDRRRRMVAPLAWGAAAVPALGYLYVVDPDRPGHYPSCFVFALTGQYCPGCGLLRASHDLLHLDLAGAFARNPMVPFLAVFAAYLVFRWVAARWRGNVLTWTPSPWLATSLVVVFFGFTIARNIPGWTWLSPA